MARFVREGCLMDFDSADVPEIVFSVREKDLKSLAIPDISVARCVVEEPSATFTQSGVHRNKPLPEITIDLNADFLPVDFNEPVAEIEAIEEVAFVPEAIRPPFPEIAMKPLPPFIPLGASDPLSEMITKQEDDFFPKPIAEP